MPVKKSLSIDQKSGEEVGDEQLEETLEGILDLLNHTRYQQTDLAKAIKLLRKASARVEDKLTVRTSSS